MTVVAFRGADLPRSRKVEVFCVQAYRRDRCGLVRGRFQQFGTRAAADQAADRAARRWAGVVVYVMRGYPGSDVWDLPDVVRRLGEVEAVSWPAC